LLPFLGIFADFAHQMTYLFKVDTLARMESLDELYQEVILDHHQNPRGRQVLFPSDRETQVFNPLCGDEVKVMLTLDGDKISQLCFMGQGCSISQASASMMAEQCVGKTVAEIKEIYQKVSGLIKGSGSDSADPVLGDVVALGGVRKFPARQRCAMIAWEALMKCLG
jgi:nitrogen fixation NifU-like protein